jgi:L-ribulose-5-phosphate 4-epimerase
MTSFAELRHEVWRANRRLPELGLVVMHSGNVSGIDRGAGLVLIKPSGVDYETLRPQDLAVVTLDGDPVGSDEVPDGVASRMRPSVDLSHHLVLYRKDPDIGGVVHTHSNHATAFAAAGRPIPCALTAMADEFGGEIPCAPYTDNDGDHIGDAILSARTRAPAVLLANHGVFAFGASPARALKTAAMVEDAARTLVIAMGLGSPSPIAHEEIEKWWKRYHETYGQPT